MQVLGPVYPAWALLFADDWDVTAAGGDFVSTLLMSLWCLVLLRVPLSWKKCAGGFTYSWVGLEKSLKEWSLGISARRAQWLEGWFTRVLKVGRLSMRELREALG